MMTIIALAWIYVVFMMALTEPSILAGIMTFVSYCIIPLGLVWLVTIYIKHRFVQPRK